MQMIPVSELIELTKKLELRKRVSKETGDYSRSDAYDSALTLLRQVIDNAIHNTRDVANHE